MSAEPAKELWGPAEPAKEIWGLLSEQKPVIFLRTVCLALLAEVSVLPGPAAIKSQRITQRSTLFIN